MMICRQVGKQSVFYWLEEEQIDLLQKRSTIPFIWHFGGLLQAYDNPKADAIRPNFWRGCTRLEFFCHNFMRSLHSSRPCWRLNHVASIKLIKFYIRHMIFLILIHVTSERCDKFKKIITMLAHFVGFECLVRNEENILLCHEKRGKIEEYLNSLYLPNFKFYCILI